MLGFVIQRYTTRKHVFDFEKIGSVSLKEYMILSATQSKQVPRRNFSLSMTFKPSTKHQYFRNSKIVTACSKFS